MTIHLTRRDATAAVGVQLVLHSLKYDGTVCVCVSLPLPLPPEWCPGTEGYILSSRRNIALRNDSSQTQLPVLYSNAPTYFCGQTLTFK